MTSLPIRIPAPKRSNSRRLEWHPVAIPATRDDTPLSSPARRPSYRVLRATVVSTCPRLARVSGKRNHLPWRTGVGLREAEVAARWRPAEGAAARKVSDLDAAVVVALKGAGCVNTAIRRHCPSGDNAAGARSQGGSCWWRGMNRALGGRRVALTYRFLVRRSCIILCGTLVARIARRGWMFL